MAQFIRLIACLVATTVLAAACQGATVATEGSANAGESSDAALRLATLTSLDERVAEVAWRLSAANVDLCPVVRPSAGWTLHAANQYSEELRPLAEQRFGLVRDLPGLLVVPPRSPAHRAGLRPGDLLLSINGRALTPGDVRTRAAYEGLAANIRQIDLALAEGPVDLSFQRNGQALQARVIPQTGCGYEVQLDPSDELNARADGKRLFITTAIASFAATDDELALILSHELAHHVLGHRSWHEAEDDGRQAQDVPSFRPMAGGGERQADRVGLFLMARAGFDPGVAPDFWRRFGDHNWRVRYPQLGHPSAGARAEALELVVAEIERLKVAGEPISP